MTASAETITAWDPAAVVAAAKELIHSTNYEKVGDARATVDSVIAQWVQIAGDPGVAADPTRRRPAEQAIVQIWTLYAALEIELRQFKQATKVFESAVSCPIAGAYATLWLAYAAFCIDRKKFSNARKVFVRGLRAVAPSDHSDLWTQFHAFIVEHLDPAMTLQALQVQVFPEKNWVAESQPVGSEGLSATINGSSMPATKPTSEVATPGTHGGKVVENQNGNTNSSAERAVAPSSQLPIDPRLAFVDKKGDDAVEASVTGKRKAADGVTSSPAKQVKTELTQPPTSIATTGEAVGYFLEMPTTLPITPGCPHLLFDQMETPRPIENELLEKLSHVLSDNAVFQGVRALYDNQRQRDREMLYRWQDLVGMQMKEGTDLFARHANAEKSVTEPSALGTLKAKHLEQRREFVSRCQMSQHQFIEVCEVDRGTALKAQQISLLNMKIPEMTVATEHDVIELQRAILGLILEAEKLSREESMKKAADSQRQKKPHFTAKTGPHRPRSDSRDRDSYGRGGGRGGRGGGGGFSRGGGSFGRNGGFRRQFADSPPRSGRGQPRRHDGYAPHPSAGSRTYDNASRQSHSSFQGSNSQRSYPNGSTSGRGYGDYSSRDRPAPYDRAEDRRPPPSYNRGGSHEVVAPPPRFADTPPAARSGPAYGSQDPYHGANPHGPPHGGRGPPATRHVEYERGNRYGGAPNGGRGAFSTSPSNRYGGEPVAAPAARYGGEANAPMNRYGSEPVAVSNRYGGEPTAPPPNRYGGEPPALAPQQQQYAAPPHSYDYAPPNSTPYGYDHHPALHTVPQQRPHPGHYGQPPAAVYSQPTPAPVYQQPPPQQHAQPLPYHHQHQHQHHQPPPQQQQQQPQHGYGAPPPAYQAPPPQSRPPPQQHRPSFQTSPPRSGGGRGGYDRFRRGGGGGGRYGRR